MVMLTVAEDVLTVSDARMAMNLQLISQTHTEPHDGRTVDGEETKR